jgi:hypothetical protein
MEATYVRIEDVAMIADFSEITATRKFEKLDPPETFKDYMIHYGGNFFFISNDNEKTVRFHQADFERQVHDGAIEAWIRKIKGIFPNF